MSAAYVHIPPFTIDVVGESIAVNHPVGMSRGVEGAFRDVAVRIITSNPGRKVLYRVRVTPKARERVELDHVVGSDTQNVSFMPRDPIPPIQPMTGRTFVWKVSDAAVMWLSHHTRLGRRFTCAEIAVGIMAEKHIFGFTRLNPQDVNAAFSGVSIRAKPAHKRWVTDEPGGGLNVPWVKRLWSLTPKEGVSHARALSQSRNALIPRIESGWGRRGETRAS